MIKTKIIINQERPFHFDQLFFSTTDKKGIITSCNQTFIDIAGFQKEELIGAPHSIIRHPEMPRGVFALFWHYLENDKPIAAYVKNIAADGKYYWVMAFASPYEDGYLSVRFKPCSEVFELVVKIYSDLLNWEKALAESGIRKAEVAKRSMDELLKRLKELGFSNYDDFFEYALPLEFKARRDKLINFNKDNLKESDELVEQVSNIDSSLELVLQELNTFSNVRNSLIANSKFIEGLAQNLNLTSLNALVAAERLGEEGRVVSTVAQHIGITAQESGNSIKSIQNSTSIFIPKLRFASFSVAIAKLQIEMLLEFLKEVAKSEDDNCANTITVLSRATKDRIKMLNNSIEFTAEHIDGLSNGLDTLKKSLVCLESVQVYGLVEAARITTQQSFKIIFDGIRDQVSTGKEKVALLEDEIHELARLCQASLVKQELPL